MRTIKRIKKELEDVKVALKKAGDDLIDLNYSEGGNKRAVERIKLNKRVNFLEGRKKSLTWVLEDESNA